MQRRLSTSTQIEETSAVPDLGDWVCRGSAIYIYEALTTGLEGCILELNKRDFQEDPQPRIEARGSNIEGRQGKSGPRKAGPTGVAHRNDERRSRGVSTATADEEAWPVL